MNKNKNKNIITELIFTIALPVLILNKLSNYFEESGPAIALVVALSFPVIYFFWDLNKTKHISIISIFGFISILLTGSFALLHLNSHWFAIKEMLIPFLIGTGVLFTSFTQKPAISRLLNNNSIINLDLLTQKLTNLNTQDKYKEGLKVLTRYLSIALFISAIINYVLAVNIILDLPLELAAELKLKLRNEQIAELTWKSYFVILIPTMIMMSFILWRTNKLLRDCTGLGFDDLTKHNET